MYTKEELDLFFNDKDILSALNSELTLDEIIENGDIGDQNLLDIYENISIVNIECENPGNDYGDTEYVTIRILLKSEMYDIILRHVVGEFLDELVSYSKVIID